MLKEIALLIGLGVYIIGFGLMFLIQAQSPATLGLALVRSAAWPVSVVLRHEWPRGQRLPIGDEDLM
jgi:hypothetical protein